MEYIKLQILDFLNYSPLKDKIKDVLIQRLGQLQLWHHKSKTFNLMD
jgi:hypothetical protein